MTFWQIQLFQKFSQSSVTIVSWNKSFTFCYRLFGNGPVDSGEIHNINAIRLYLYCNRLTRHIISVVKSINHSLLNCLIRIILNPQSFHLIWNLDYFFSYKKISKSFHCCLNHLWYGTCNIRKILAYTWIFYTPLRKWRHLNIGVWEKPVWMFTKHHDCHILNIT